MSVLKIDPTRTTMLRKKFAAEVDRRFSSLKRDLHNLIEIEDAFGLKREHRQTASMPKLMPLFNSLTTNTRWRFLTTAEQLEAFKGWLGFQISQKILGAVEKGEDSWLQAYINEAHQKGIARVFDDVRKPALAKSLPFYQGSKQEFLQSAFSHPVSIERVKLLASRSFTDLKGITEAMSQGISRNLVDGMIQGKSPRDVARDIAKTVDGVGRKRALVMARTETIRAHAEGQLDSFERLGVERLGVAVEWSTSDIGITAKGNPSPCELCAPLRGMVLTVKEARGLLPRHPNCMCSFIPAGVGESTAEQLLTKQRIRGAIAKSLKAEFKGRRTAKGRAKASRWVGAGRTIAAKRPRSIIANRSLTADKLNLRWYVHNNCGTGAGGFKPGNKCALGGGSAGQLPNPDSVKILMALGGSTGAKLVEDKDGKKWVMKRGLSADHIRNEAEADELYRTLGANVPNGGIVEHADGPVKFTEYLEGAKTLAEYKATASQKDIDAIHSEISKHFVADALLANWDVVGLSQDNIMIHNGKAYRIDNGGSLRYRAQGGLKGHKFTDDVGEISTLRNASLNPNSAKVFSKLDNTDIMLQSQNVLAKRQEILATASGSKGKLTARLDDLELKFNTLKQSQQTANPVAPKPVSAVLKTVSATSSQFNSAESLTSYLQANKGDTKIGTKGYAEKIKFLNQHGIINNTFYMPLMGATKGDPNNAKNLEHLQKILPAGTVIKTVWTSNKQIQQGTAKLPKHIQEAQKSVVKGVFSKPGGLSTVEDGTKLDPVLSINNRTRFDSKFYDETILKYQASIKGEARSAIKDWSNGEYRTMRKNISSTGGTGTNTKEKSLLAAIDKAPMAPQKFVAYRGVKDSDAWGVEFREGLKKAGVGGTWSEPCPASSSLKAERGYAFASGGVLLKVTTQRAAAIKKISHYASEDEVLLKPNITYKIARVVENAKIAGAGQVRLYVELIEE